MAEAIHRKCSKNLSAMASYTRSSSTASSMLICSMSAEKNAIQVVPSDCSR